MFLWQENVPSILDIGYLYCCLFWGLWDGNLNANCCAYIKIFYNDLTNFRHITFEVHDGSLFSYVATHQLSQRHNTIKCRVMSSVNSALDETRANRDCQEVYGSGEWEHCCVSMEICLRGGKMATYTGNYFLDIHPSHFKLAQRTSVLWANPVLQMNLSHRFGGLESLKDNTCSWGQMFLNVITNIHLLTNTCEVFMSGDVGKAFLEKSPSCFGIHLRVRCHQGSHEPQVWMSYK